MAFAMLDVPTPRKTHNAAICDRRLRCVVKKIKFDESQSNGRVMLLRIGLKDAMASMRATLGDEVGPEEELQDVQEIKLSQSGDNDVVMKKSNGQVTNVDQSSVSMNKNDDNVDEINNNIVKMTNQLKTMDEEMMMSKMYYKRMKVTKGKYEFVCLICWHREWNAPDLNRHYVNKHM